jgi:hypothetical protein
LSIIVKWGDPNLKILCYTVADPWRWEDFYSAIERGRQMREPRGPGHVNVIVDFSASHKIPDGALSHFGNMFKRGAPSTDRVERVIVVKPTSFLLAIAQILMKLNPVIVRKVAFANSLEDAYFLLAPQEARR